MCRAGHRLVALVTGLRIHAKQVAVAQLAQDKGFAVLLKVDGAVFQSAARAMKALAQAARRCCDNCARTAQQ